MLQEGMSAPDFKLKDQDGTERALSDYRGKKVVLYFYPKDNTPGCTREACSYASHQKDFEEKNVEILGLSKDSVASHTKFKEKYQLPFTLLSDPELSAIISYGALKEEGTKKVERSTFLIDEEGKILKIMRKVKADENAEDVLKLL